MSGHNYPNDPTLEYDVWGGYEGQDYGEHWATWSTLAEAQAYRREQLAAGRPGLHLLITPVKNRAAALEGDE